MTTATAVTWPTQEDYARAGKALSTAYNEVEALSIVLDKVIRPYMDEGVFPDPLPTLETIGLLYSFVETFESEARQLKQCAESFEEDLRQIDDIRLNAELAHAG